MRRKAVFSDCERYRYALHVSVSALLPRINFLMLNPSTADHMKNDPTVAKCWQWALAWGFGSLVVTNLFAWRSTDPKAMMRESAPVGPDNDMHILEAAKESLVTVCAWGKDGNHMGRADDVYALVKGARIGRELTMLRVTKKEPWHPLYLPNETKPKTYLRHAERQAA